MGQETSFLAYDCISSQHKSSGNMWEISEKLLGIFGTNFRINNFCATRKFPQKLR